MANVVRALGLAVAVAGVAGCVTTLNTFPPLGSTPQPPGDASSRMVVEVIGILRTKGIEADVAVRPFRPAEGPLLAAAPRTVIEVKLPDAQSHAWIVVYELPTDGAATSAAQDHAAYVAAGIGGGVLFPPGTRFVLQVSGTSVIFFSWLPATSPDARIATVAEALQGIGSPIDVPR